MSASDVVDMSNDPDNNNLVSNTIDSELEESVGDSDTNQLSNEEDSSLGPNEGDDSHETIFDDTQSSGNSQNTNKAATTLEVSKSTLYAGNPVIATLKDKNGNVLSGKKILFTIDNKVYTKTTNSKGQAKLILNSAKIYKIKISFAGDNSFNASKLTVSIKVLKSSTSLKVTNSTVPRSTCLIVTLRNEKSGSVISGKTIKFVIPNRNNETYKKVTDSKGQAKLVINSKKNFYIVISYAGNDNLYKSSTATTVKPIKCGTKIVTSSTIKFGEDLIVSLKKIPTNGAVKNRVVVVKITDKNKTYTKKTNSNGKITIPINFLGTANVKVSFAGDDMYIKSSKKTNLTVKKGTTSLISPTNVGKGFDYVVTLKNSAGKVLANKKVVIKFNNKTYTKITNSKGKVSLRMNLKKGSYPIVVSYAGSKYYGSSKLSKTIKIVDPSISISKIVTAAKDLKLRVEYINILNKSYTVTIDNRKYTIDEFAYLMSGALTNINKGSKANVVIKDLSNNYNSSGSKISGKLNKTEYLKLAKGVIAFVDSNKRIPNYKTTSLGKMEANLYVYTFAAALNYYGNNNRLPSYVTVKTSYVRGGYSISISQNGKILNYRQIFDSDEFAKYLKTGGKSALNDAIKKKAKELTAGLSSPKAKANAIFEFVRDDIKYSFYTNSLKGAKGTLSSKSGNCCDKANLIVAMCRSVGIYARYSHAKNCKFASGLNTGHVWAQVYDPISQTWYTADATSRRNNLGQINNWNTKSYSEPKNYVLIPF